MSSSLVTGWIIFSTNFKPIEWRKSKTAALFWRDSFVPIYRFIKDIFSCDEIKPFNIFDLNVYVYAKKKLHAHREMRKSLSQDWLMIETEREVVRGRETVGTKTSLFLSFTISTCWENGLTKLYFTLSIWNLTMTHTSSQLKISFIKQINWHNRLFSK